MSHFSGFICFICIWEISFKDSSLPPPPSPPPRVQSVYRYRGDTFLGDGLRHFQYFQAVTLQQDQEVAR